VRFETQRDTVDSSNNFSKAKGKFHWERMRAEMHGARNATCPLLCAAVPKIGQRGQILVEFPKINKRGNVRVGRLRVTIVVVEK